MEGEVGMSFLNVLGLGIWLFNLIYSMFWGFLKGSPHLLYSTNRNANNSGYFISLGRFGKL